MTPVEKGTLELETYSFKWKIPQFFADCQNFQDYYTSPKFEIPYDDKVSKWYLYVSPKGDTDEHKDCIGLYLCLDFYRKDEFDEYEIITADFKMSILNDKNNAPIEHKYMFKFKAEDDICWGSDEFVKQNVIKNEKNGYLNDDTLTILCEVKLYPPGEDDTDELESYGDWQDKIEKGLSDYEKILDTSDFNDVTFDMQGQKIKAHKNILSCQSPVFQAMFEHEMKEKRQNLVEITDINHEVMMELFRYIYSGKVKNIEKFTGDLMIAADKYQVIGLKALCEKTFYEKLTVENAIEYLIVSDMCDTIHLKRLLVNYVAENHAEIVKNPEFKNLSKDLMYEVMLALSRKRRGR